MVLKGFDKERPRFRVSELSVLETPWESRVSFRASTTNTAGGMFIQTFILRYVSASFNSLPVIVSVFS